MAVKLKCPAVSVCDWQPPQPGLKMFSGRMLILSAILILACSWGGGRTSPSNSTWASKNSSQESIVDVEFSSAALDFEFEDDCDLIAVPRTALLQALYNLAEGTVLPSLERYRAEATMFLMIPALVGVEWFYREFSLACRKDHRLVGPFRRFVVKFLSLHHPAPLEFVRAQDEDTFQQSWFLSEVRFERRLLGEAEAAEPFFTHQMRRTSSSNSWWKKAPARVSLVESIVKTKPEFFAMRLSSRFLMLLEGIAPAELIEFMMGQSKDNPLRRVSNFSNQVSQCGASGGGRSKWMMTLFLPGASCGQTRPPSGSNGTSWYASAHR